MTREEAELKFDAWFEERFAHVTTIQPILKAGFKELALDSFRLGLSIGADVAPVEQSPKTGGLSRQEVFDRYLKPEIELKFKAVMDSMKEEKEI